MQVIQQFHVRNYPQRLEFVRCRQIWLIDSNALMIISDKAHFHLDVTPFIIIGPYFFDEIYATMKEKLEHFVYRLNNFCLSRNGHQCHQICPHVSFLYGYIKERVYVHKLVL